jgi:hypothetical protein
MDTFDSIARANPDYVEALYRRYRADPRSVDESWALVFAGYDFALAAGPSATGRTSPPVADLVHSYRELGHLIADVNPLDRSPRRHPLLELGEFGFEQADLDRVVLDRLRSPVLVFDAAGLALFAVSGTQKALAYGLEPVMAALLGMLTGIGGGMVRDLLVTQIPPSCTPNCTRWRRSPARRWWWPATCYTCRPPR